MDKLKCAFNKFIGLEGDEKSGGLFYLFVIAIGATVIIYLVAIAITGNSITAGAFGDFIGGTLNPILTFMTFMGLLITIVLQQAELKQTRLELSRSATALESQLKATDKQSFESTFFQMLQLHNTIVNSIDLHIKGRTFVGRDCFRIFYADLSKEFATRGGGNNVELIDVCFHEVWFKRQGDLGHYYRYLYNIVRFVDESAFSHKRRYMKLLRAQLSDDELLMLFYNCYTTRGKNFKRFVAQYHLCNNLPAASLLTPEHQSWLHEMAEEGNSLALTDATVS